MSIEPGFIHSGDRLDVRHNGCVQASSHLLWRQCASSRDRNLLTISER